MKVVYFGKGLRGKICLEKIIKIGFKIVAFLGESKDDICFKYATQKKIKTIIPKFVNSLDTENELRKLNADIFVLCGYSKIIKKT